MSHYKPYAVYKDSGVEWLGWVPEHWQVMAIKHIVSTPITDGPHETPEFLDDGVPFVSAEAVSAGKVDFEKIRGFISREDHERYSQKYCPQRGDIFMIKSGATTGVTAIVDTDEEFNIWSPLAVIRCGERSIPYFVLNFMRSRSFQEAVTLSWSYGTQQNIGMGVIGNLAVTVPPQEEQQVIAAHLDRETARIDALVEKKTRFIGLLLEKRQALITHAVTKGIDPNVKMKDSRVEWLGEIPEHWGISPLNHLVRFRSGGTPSKDNLELWDGYIPWASAKDLKQEVLADTIDHLTESAIESGAASLIPSGSVLVVVRGMILARLFPVVETLVPMAINQDLKALIPSENINARYLAQLLRGSSAESLSRLEEAGHGTKALRMENWISIKLPVPPLQEQLAIIAMLDIQTARIDVLADKTERSIELLKERRSALITAAVTGQIDLREAV
ncbi:restriction endonuclease subunit S [Pseudomonas putida]|uniref:restriction endonuclease subunit S n=1 Tax=Pseudomonas putida TaxID=303 RepID=UPI00117AA066|nr:restriction endonuclease subunit S [Pseudomonas putida]TRO31973.1 restriction endonuclease subunit S [Pseudomonas putida]